MLGDMGGHGGFKAGLCNRQAIKNWPSWYWVYWVCRHPRSYFSYLWMHTWNRHIWLLKEPHIGFLAQRTRAVKMGKMKWKPLNQSTNPAPGQDDIPKTPYGSEDLFIICWYPLEKISMGEALLTLQCRARGLQMEQPWWRSWRQCIHWFTNMVFKYPNLI